MRRVAAPLTSSRESWIKLHAYAFRCHWIHRKALKFHLNSYVDRGQSYATENRFYAVSANDSSVAQPALVWFKHDLRLDDHPGLQAALENGTPVIPVFCFDPRHYSSLADTLDSAKALIKAVSALQIALRSKGSNLIVVHGPVEDELPRLASEFGTNIIYTEDEVEKTWLDAIHAVSMSLPSTVSLKLWTAYIFQTHVDDYMHWLKARGSASPPIDIPDQIPSPPLLDAVEPCELTLESVYASLSTLERPNSLNRAATVSSDGRVERTDEVVLWGNGSSSIIHSVVTPSAAYLSEPLAATVVAGSGESAVVAAVQAYLRHMETDGYGESQEGNNVELRKSLAEAVQKHDVAATPQGCFPALFTRALGLGVISRRRIFDEAQKALDISNLEMPMPQGVVQKIGWLLTSRGGALSRNRFTRKALAATRNVEAADFHIGMAAGRKAVSIEGATVHHWRWRGYLTDYLAAKTENTRTQAPAILLVHGFGAFSMHYRACVGELAKRGYDVYAPTLPGYGRSEKPALAYGQDLWRDFIADFARDVIKRPVVVAGNSIGGFMAASLAADYPGYVLGLVLLNSAGQLSEGYTPAVVPPEPPTPNATFVAALSSTLFSFLERGVEEQLKRVYPVRPERADAWLANEISRAARDPGALGVFRSVFYLPKPRALNYLVNTFGGPTLVLQGAKDPLNNARKRAQEIERLCSNTEVVLLNAGHCPHDEVAEVVVARLDRWIQRRVVQPVHQVIRSNA